MAMLVRLSFWIALTLGVAVAGNASESWQDLLAQGMTLHHTGSYLDAVQALRQALNLAEGSTANERSIVTIHEALGSTYADLGQGLEATYSYRRALKLIEKLEGRESLDYAFVLSEMGNVPGSNEVSPEMFSTLKRAAGMHAEADEQVKLTSVRIGLASLYQKAHKYKEAEPLLLDAINDLKEQKVADPPNLVRVFNTLAILRFKQERYTEALDLSTQVLELSQIYYGREHPMIVLALGNMANALYCLHQLKAAQASYDRALALANKVLTEDDPTYLALLANYSVALRKMGRKQEAKLMAARSKRMGETLDRTNGPKSTVTVGELRAKR